jgi:hypothetical protein
LSQILSQIFSKEIVLNAIAALIAAEIVYIITLVMEHYFYKVDRAITGLKDEIKEKNEIIKSLLQDTNTKAKEL